MSSPKKKPIVNQVTIVKGYERKGPVISIDEIFKILSLSKKVKLNGVSVKLKSQRLKVFKKMGIKCVCCGLVGKYFAVERHKGSTSNYHLNLYALDDNSKEILMTKDHIIPRSLGGKNTMDNYQTMCAPCNSRKGNLINFSVE